MKPILFIDRDGTLIKEPVDYQIDSIEKLDFLPGVFESLINLKKNQYDFVMITNQDGLGTDSFPTSDFQPAHDLMVKIFKSQGIEFKEILICPHLPEESCRCRKPELGLVIKYLQSTNWDRKNSYVIGDRDSDLKLADNMGINSIKITNDVSDQSNAIHLKNWSDICEAILKKPRKASLTRETKETNIQLDLNIDGSGKYDISTGLLFFDHMLEQIAKHGKMDLTIKADGDIERDDHHTVEDVGILLGEAFKKALGQKVGIERYSTVTVMDETRSEVSMDICGRFYFISDLKFNREIIKDLSTEMVPHFFRSFAEKAQLTLHMKSEGENEHHKVESLFKCFARALNKATTKTSNQLPTTKGLL